MASSEQLARNHTALVSNAFVEQYYNMLHTNPKEVYKFYHDDSKLGRPEKDGMMGITTTLKDINEKIQSLDEFVAEIKSVDAQESLGGGFLIMVTGFMVGDDTKRKKFSQSFFLAPQEGGGYFVLNDVFRYVNDNEGEFCNDNVEAPATPDDDPSSQQIHVSDNVVIPAEDANGEEVYEPEIVQVPIEEEAPVAEVVDEIPDDSLVVAGLTSIEEVPKKSYASIVMKESAALSPVATTTPVRSATKSRVQHAAAALPAPAVSEMNASNTSVVEPGSNQETEAEGYSIYVRSLPGHATPSLLEAEFKKFGPIKRNGIQVRTQRGFCFGFVEFEVASAVQSALEASPVLISGRKVFVEEKKSTNRGNGRPRYSSGRGAGYRNEGRNEGGGYRNEGRNEGGGYRNVGGGYRSEGRNEGGGYRNEGRNEGGGYRNDGRNDGGRGRGNHGNGRSYGRGDFSRAESGYRNGNHGGYSNRGNNGFQRVDHVENNGGRVNRNGGLAINSIAKTATVAASA